MEGHPGECFNTNAPTNVGFCPRGEYQIRPYGKNCRLMANWFQPVGPLTPS